MQIIVDAPATVLEGWSCHYDQPYSHETTAGDLAGVPADAAYVFVGARSKDGATIKVGACGERGEVLRATELNKPHEHNGAWWYNTAGKSFGFAPSGTVNQEIPDIHDQGDARRLSWNNSGSYAGYRAGSDCSGHGVPCNKILYYSNTPGEVLGGTGRTPLGMAQQLTASGKGNAGILAFLTEAAEKEVRGRTPALTA